MGVVLAIGSPHHGFLRLLKRDHFRPTSCCRQNMRPAGGFVGGIDREGAESAGWWPLSAGYSAFLSFQLLHVESHPGGQIEQT